MLSQNRGRPGHEPPPSHVRGTTAPPATRWSSGTPATSG